MKLLRSYFLVLLCLLTSSSYALDSVKLQLKWKHQFQFAGYYMAKELGIYESAGLDVTIIEAEPGIKVVDEVLSGRVDFATGASDLLLYRAQGDPLVVLSVIFQHSPVALAVAEGVPLEPLSELVKRPFMIEEHAAEVWAYFQNNQITKQQVNVKQHSFDPQDLIDGRVDGMTIYSTDEPFSLNKAGFEYQLINPVDAGVDFYGDNLFTTESLMQEKPEVVAAFRAASIAGWKYAFSHIDETINLIHMRYSQRKSIDHLRFEAEKMLELIQPDIVEPGYMQKQRWQNILDIYVSLGLLQSRPDLDRFLYKANRPKDYSGLYQIIILIVSITVILSLILSRFIWLTWRLKREVKQRENVESELRATADDLQKANIFKSRFLASVSHDLRTPLTAVIGFSEQALIDSSSQAHESKISASLQSVLSSGLYMQEMLDELSDMAQLESGTLQIQPVILELLPLLYDTQLIMQSRLGDKAVTLSLDLKLPLPKQLYADATRLRQVLFNLLGNAIKFTEQGEVKLIVSATDNHLMCQVEDTGIGIASNALENLFKPFEQAHRNVKYNYGGTGLGLYICKSLIEAMQGIISVESSIGKGSRFYFKIPIGIDKPELFKQGDALPCIDSGVPAKDESLCGHILLADDVLENRQLLKAMLASESLKVDTVDDGVQALAAVGENNYDVVLMDIHMPVLSGMDALLSLRNQGNNLPVIALTAANSQAQVDSYYSAGFDGVLTKPIERKKLYQLLSEYLEPEGILGDPDRPIDNAVIQEKIKSKLPLVLNDMQVAFQQQDYIALQHYAHQHIGSTGTLGFVVISRLFQDLELSAKSSNKAQCEKLLVNLDEAIAKL